MQAKYLALLLLVGQTVGAITTLRYSRLTTSSDGFQYLNTSAVLLTEVLKVLLSFGLVLRELRWSLVDACLQVDEIVFRKPLDTLKVGVPAILYTLQNNLIFIALSNMSPALYQVTYQLKILSTAVLSVLVLKRVLSKGRWISLFLLTMGVALIQLPTPTDSTSNTLLQTSKGNFAVGMAAVLCACVTSGFAGVYLEKIVKESGKVSVWMRNIQLAFLGTVIASIMMLWKDWKALSQHGMLQGYTPATWAAILLQGLGGLIVAAVLKYADNILKCFGNALAIVLSCLLSYYLFGDFRVTWTFVLGTALVVTSTYTYGIDCDFAILSRKYKLLAEETELPVIGASPPDLKAAALEKTTSV